MEKRKVSTSTPVLLVKRKRTDDSEDIEVSPPLKIKDRTRNQVASAGYHFGCYVKDFMDAGRLPVDFGTFVAAMPVNDLILAPPKQCLSILHAAQEQIALNTSATSASKITDIKLAVDIIKSLPTDLQRTFPNLSGQLNTMVHNMHSLLKSNDQHLREYIQKTKEHLQTVQRTQDMLQEYGLEEEKKLQKRVIDSINDRLEKLQKLLALFGDD